jgi:PAS domain S-box-containing protein
MRRWTQRAVPWVGGLFIAAIVALAAYDIVESYRTAVSNAGRELDAQARVIAEQTARSLQAVDVVLRHLVQQHRQGALDAMSPRELHEHLREQAAGLVQISGLTLVQPSGAPRAVSDVYPIPAAAQNVSGLPIFQRLRAGRNSELYIEDAMQSLVDRLWIFPIGRRLETPAGGFAGGVGARGRVDYFERFYGNLGLDSSITINLMRDNGTLLARHPRVESALGQRFALFDELLALHNSGVHSPARAASPIDGVERFGSLKLVPDYPLAVIVTRDVSAALAPWRAQSIGTAVRTLALSALAAFLLYIVTRQLSRLQRARESLETSQERYSVAVAGSDDGIFDWDYRTGKAFGSARSRAILGLPPGPEVQTLEEWFAALERQFHPEDLPRRLEAIRAHLAGEIPAYEGDFRVRDGAGGWRWVRIRGMCVRKGSEKPHRMAGSIADIDAHKRAQQALRESEERFALAVAGSNDGIVDWDVVNDRMFSSERAMEIVGIDSKVTVRTRAEWTALVNYHPDDLARMKKDLADFLEGRSDMRDGEYRVLLPNGEYRWIRHRNKCVRDLAGRPIRVAGSVSDVDARRRAEDALRQSEERFTLAVAGSNDGIMDWDIASDRMYTSERAMEILNIDSKETVRPRMELRALLQYHPDDTPRVRDDLDGLLVGRTELRDAEYRVDLGGGRYRWIRYRNKCVRDASGRPVRVAGSVSDIDAQKRIEEALRDSEEQYRAIFNAAADALVLRAADANVVDVNPAFLQISGYAREEVVNSNRWMFAIPEMRELGAEMHRRVIAGESVRFEIQAQHKSGARMDIEMRAVPIRYRGEPHALGMARDITAQKRAEEALRASEEQYKAVFNGAADALVVRDADSRVVDVNPAFVQMMGYGREEIVGSTAWSFSGRSDFSRAIHARVIAGESMHFEISSRRKDGTPIELDVRAVPIRHFGKPHTLGMARDITAQKRAAAALRESEERYQLAVAGANQGLWDWDLKADTMFVSARAQEFMGLTPGEPLRPRREWIALSTYHPDDVDAARAAMSDHLHGKTRFYTVEYRLQHPSGNWHWYRQRGVALRDGQGRPYRMAGSMEDITAQKDLEGQLLQAKKLEAIGTLAGGIAHDFNNILAAILGYGEMAQKSAGAGTPLRRHVDAVVSAGQRAKSLVERILAFSRSGIGERRPVHVQSVVAEALELVAASLPKHVRLVRALVAGEAAVLGDATQIHQVVMNLCANGAQAMKSEGTLAVSLDVVEKTRSMAATSALPAGRYVRLIVRDTGTGIPAKILERIFDPFFTTKEVGVGTGLGLSLVHGIVTDLGGGIEVDSRPGEGAAFTVYLPLSGAAAASAAADEAVPEGSGETVLIVDDEETLVRLGEEMIAGLGYEPVGFASSAAALESFRASPERFHAVLTDESMPELTGSELAREIRGLRADIPIVIMTGVVTPALSARARELGGVDVLAKPLAERELARSLAAALHSKGEVHE